MPGPAPKPADRRARRNATTGSRTLPAAGRPGKAPALGVRPATANTMSKRPAWLKATRVWWAAIWSSPMAIAWLDADVGPLRRLALMHDDFWRGDLTQASEMRQLEDRFGLGPLARRKLEWTVGNAEAEQPAPGKPARRTKGDPRHLQGLPGGKG